MAAPFRLARILRLRERVRELRELEARALDGRRGALQARQGAVGRERRRVLEGQAQAASGAPMSAQDFGARMLYAEALAAAERRLGETIVEVSDALEGKREEVARERREERKLLRLEERHRARVAREGMRQAELLLDELALLRRRRPAGEGGAGGE